MLSSSYRWSNIAKRHFRKNNRKCYTVPLRDITEGPSMRIINGRK